MNWDKVEGNWKQLKGSVQARWGKLTDDDFDVVEGNPKRLAGRIQEKYGIAQDEARLAGAVETHPYVALGMAAGIGLLLGARTRR